MGSRLDRAHDVVLFGATGFTGRLVAEYLVLHGPPSLRLALAGRSRDKLEAARRDLAVHSPRATELPLLLGDARDQVAVEAMASSARVVCTTVGPYSKYGAALVAACARVGTDYCDLTGEVPFMRETIDRHDATAKTSGARIVHACGFDSIPSDLGVFLAAHHLRETHDVGLAHDHGYFGESKGGFSGGTVDSALYMMEQAAHDRSLRRLLADPYALVPDRTKDRGAKVRDQTRPMYSEELGRWTAPFLMASVNTRVVRRSNALLGGYGRDFRYAESMTMARGAKGFLAATAFTAALGALFGALSVPPARKLIARALPSPGEGPDKAKRDAGYFVTRHVATSDADEKGRTHRVLVTVRGTSDPGYGETAKMLGESALCLALDPLPDGRAGDHAGGVTTPAASMGMRLVERLRTAGMEWNIGTL